MIIFVDLETIPSQKTGARDHCRASIKPPGTLKKPESIASWWKDEADSAVEDAYRRQSLDGGAQGEIVSIACAMEEHDKSWTYCRRQNEPEADLLRAFFTLVDYWQSAAAHALLDTHHDEPSAWPMDEPHLVAHNASFDIPFLWRRACVLGVPFPSWLPSPANLRTLGRNTNATCTMELWAGRGGRASLGSLCRALSIDSPKDGGFDGSQIYDAWLAGRYEEIAKYNLGDVVATARVWHRLQGGAA